MKKLTVKVLGVAAALIATSYLAAPDLPARSRVTDPIVPTGNIEVTTDTSSLPEIDRLIHRYEQQVSVTPTSSALDFLARLHLLEGRITGEAGAYQRAQSAVQRSLAMAPADPEGRSILASVRYTSHDFLGALQLAREIAANDPTQLDSLSVVGDASAELGDYTTARHVFDDLTARVPGSASLTVRRARLAYITGDVAQAATLARTAEREARSSGAFGTNLAYYASFQGQLAFDQGHYRNALVDYRRALGVAPGDRIASIGMARALAANGDIDEAVAVYRNVTERYPDPVALASLGDLLRQSGDTRGADDAYAVVEATATLARFNKQIYNRQLVLFYANHDRNTDEAVRLARAELRNRKDIYGYDALAWAELKAGDISSASEASAHALSLGTADASLHYHAGMIAKAKGNPAAAIEHLRLALKLSPEFDPLQALTARNALAELRAASGD